jgi:hypothetical protein
MNKWMGWWLDGKIYIWMDKWVDGCGMAGWEVGWMVEWVEDWMGG